MLASWDLGNLKQSLRLEESDRGGSLVAKGPDVLEELRGFTVWLRALPEERLQRAARKLVRTASFGVKPGVGHAWTRHPTGRSLKLASLAKDVWVQLHELWVLTVEYFPPNT